MSTVSSTPVKTDINTFDFWARPWAERDEAFRQLRETEPVKWFPPAESLLVPPELNQKGFWSVFRHADIQKVSRNPEVFISGEGVFMEDFPPEVREASLSFIVTDAPRHTQLRGIVQVAFSPRHIRQLESEIRGVARDLVDTMVKLDGGEVCELLAGKLPGVLFASFFGIPPGDLRDEVMHYSDHMGAWSDPETLGDLQPIELFGNAATRLAQIAIELTAERRANPGDDLLSWVIQAEFEGKKLTDLEIGSFFALLAAAAHDTTRQSIAHALWAFEQNEDQKELLLEDLEGRVDLAIEEVLRWATPLMHMRRTAATDTEIAGQPIAAGDKVVIWYTSGNRDEEVFEDPFEFRILRDPNRHLSFGGGGPHFCIGNSLARHTLRAALLEVYGRLPDIKVSEPEYLLANFVHGIKRLNATWTPSA